MRKKLTPAQEETMVDQKENKELSESEGELKRSPQQTAPSPQHESREDRLGLLSEDPKFQ